MKVQELVHHKSDDKCMAQSRAGQTTFDPFSSLLLSTEGAIILGATKCQKFGRYAVKDRYGVECHACADHVAVLMEEAGTSDAWQGDSIAVRLIDLPTATARKTVAAAKPRRK